MTRLWGDRPLCMGFSDSPRRATCKRINLISILKKGIEKCGRKPIVLQKAKMLTNSSANSD